MCTRPGKNSYSDWSEYKLQIKSNHLLLTQEAPPLMPALTSGKHHIKWTQLAELPVPLYNSYIAVQDKKLYIAGGIGPDEDTYHQVYLYDTNTDQWSQLPPSGHYLGIPHIIGGKLAIIGGRLSATEKMTNKVSTFDDDSQTWTSYYPDLRSVRSKPGVVSHLEHVIVAGGGRPTAEDDDIPVALDNIEVLNWIENLRWREVSIKLPVPMWGFIPTVFDDHLLIVGYTGADMKGYNNAYKIPVTNITATSNDQYTFCKLFKSTKWTELTAADHLYTVLVPNSSPPVVIGGHHCSGTSTPDIKMYDSSNKSWKKIGSLSSARSGVTVATVYNNAIIVIGGCIEGDTMASAKSSSLTVAEMGQLQAELLGCFTDY